MIKINIGSGYKKYPGFVNIDSDKNCNPDYTVDLDSKHLLLPFADNSVSYVLAEHILEHIGDGYFKLLQEIYRVCEHGAIIEIRVPHPFHEVYLNDPTHKRPITVEGLRLFSKEVNRHEIKTNGRSSTLGLMFDVDFQIIDYEYIYDPYYEKILKEWKYPELERLFREANNTTLEIHVKLMVIKED